MKTEIDCVDEFLARQRELSAMLTPLADDFDAFEAYLQPIMRRIHAQRCGPCASFSFTAQPLGAADGSVNYLYLIKVQCDETKEKGVEEEYVLRISFPHPDFK